MTVMLRRYSGFSPEIFEKKLVPKMSHTALCLYIFLCRTSDKKSSRQFEAPDKEITEQTGASARALSDARRNLREHSLIQYERSPGGAYMYTICDPNTGQPFPGDPKIKAQYEKKEKLESVEPPTIARKAHSKAIEQPSRRKPAAVDTSFDYGHNQYPPDKVYFEPDAFSEHK